MPVAGALIGGAAAIGGGLIASSGAKSAAKAQENAANNQLALQREMYQQTRADQAPWRNMGVSALNTIGSLYGFAPQSVGSSGGQDWSGYGQANPDVAAGWQDMLQTGEAQSKFNGDPNAYYQWHYQNYGQNEGRQAPEAVTSAGQPAAGRTGMDAFFASPDYEFRRSEGMRGLQGSAAAGGSLQSGGTLKALDRYNSGLASGEYGNWYNRLASLAGVGQTATNQLAQAGQNYATGAGNAFGNIGQANANGAIAGAQGWNSALQGVAGFGQNLLNSWPTQTPNFNPGGQGSLSYSGDTSMNGLF